MRLLHELRRLLLRVTAAAAAFFGHRVTSLSSKCSFAARSGNCGDRFPTCPGQVGDLPYECHLLAQSIASRRRLDSFTASVAACTLNGEGNENQIPDDPGINRVRRA